jgi:MFS superfamily sulfate permease-like transporter
VLGTLPETGDYVAKRWIYGRRHGITNPDAETIPGVIVYRFAAPLVFSNAEAFLDSGQALLIEAGSRGDLPHALVVDFEMVFVVDVTGAAALTSLLEYAHRYGVELVLARVHSGTHELLRRSGALDQIGEQRIYGTIRGAVDAVLESQPSDGDHQDD